MDISTANFSTTQPAIKDGTNSSVLSSDFETFLQMLTAQARYQDPLEPVDSSEYAAQLAQFSMVEQQVLSNNLLSALAETNNLMVQAAGWIGLEASSTAPVAFNGTPITVLPAPVASADQAFLLVKDAQGTQVSREQIPISADPITWAGTTDDGSPYPEGVYSFEVESVKDGEVLLTHPANTYARVTEARQQGDATLLILQGGQAVLANDITGLREAPGQDLDT